MEHDLWISLLHCRFQRLHIPDISMNMLHDLAYTSLLEKAGVRWRLQRVACYISPHFGEPKRKPTSLETRVTSDENAASTPNFITHDALQHEPCTAVVRGISCRLTFPYASKIQMPIDNPVTVCGKHFKRPFFLHPI
jgi:hypothetical protein